MMKETKSSQIRLHDITAVQRVIKRLKSGDHTTLKQGIDAAATFIGNEDICRSLVPLLDHDNDEIRYKAAFALGHVLHPHSITYLENALDDHDAKVRSTAIDALARLRAKSSAARIARKLTDHAPEVRYSASEALGQLKYVEAARHIIALLSDNEDIVRLGAAESLGYLGDSSAVSHLEKALHDEFHLVRAYAAESLGIIGNTRSKAALKQSLTWETQARVRLGIHTALYKLGDNEEFNNIISFLSEENPLARRAAATTLVELSNTMRAGSLMLYLKRAMQTERQNRTREVIQKAINILNAHNN